MESVLSQLYINQLLDYSRRNVIQNFPPWNTRGTRAHLLNEKSKRPAFSVPKQISDVTSCLLLGILSKQ